MELLAPAGNTENFLAAMEAGADAVYVGAPSINARNLARDLRFEEIFSMVQYCRENGKKIYLAANSLVREQDLPQAIETLAMLEAMNTDGLIVQDLGIVRLIREHFPAIPLHASTLLSANNSQSLHGFQTLGFERVVLARELTLKEIEILCSKSDIEIEVFVHGAMCFSYSGLCLFSSFLGGKSGLRGKCVQPCRRHYSWTGKRGGKSSSKHKSRSKTGAQTGKGQYLFSMNDLSALEAVPALQKAGVASLKIEGRLRSAHYVSHIVKAYRLVMDASPEDFSEALTHATHLSNRAMGRKTSSGYFFSPQPANAITPHHSGNMGDYLGRLGSVKSFEDRLYARLTLKEELAAGDRLRLHGEPSGERFSFTLKEIRHGNNEVDEAKAGDKVQLLVPDWEFHTNSTGNRVDVYRVDVKKEGLSTQKRLPDLKQSKLLLEEFRREKRAYIDEVLGRVASPLEDSELPDSNIPRKYFGKKAGKPSKKIKLPLDFWLRLDSAKALYKTFPFVPNRYLLPVNKSNMSQVGQLKRFLGRRVRDLTWCLPPILFEGEQVRLNKQIQLLIRSGFRSFQLGHITQFTFFQKSQRVYLSSDYTVNLLNSQAVTMMEEGGIEEAQLSIESDRKILTELIARYRRYHSELKLGLTVYGAPALFTARLDPEHFNYNKSLKSPKNEEFVLLKKENVTATVPVRPFSLLPYLHELKGEGLDYVVVDLSNLQTGKKEMEELAARLSGTGKYSKLPTFNYLGSLE
ncbi:MAG TPA: U32 family peptidase [Desulfobacterales bacterium]|nr:U32 family peptidase [Desulfobacterales bacterium]HIP39536.1 U32 family peptidase [Desulfocapsa sulfexigens]